MANNFNFNNYPVYCHYSCLNYVDNFCSPDLHYMFPPSSHLIVFMGLSMNSNLVSQIHSLYNFLKLTSVKIAIMDRGDLKGIMFPDGIIVIPFSTFSDKLVPAAFRSENYILNEFKTLQRFLAHAGLTFDYITKFRKDSIINIPLLIDFLMAIPSYFIRYKAVVSTSSSNVLRRFCLSDISFSLGFSDFMSLSFFYRNPSLFDRLLRRLSFVEIFSTSYQAEQFIWKQILQQLMPEFLLPMPFDRYIVLLYDLIYFPSPHQAGVYFSRNNDILFSNWSYFSPAGSGLFCSTRPYRDFFSLSTLTILTLANSEAFIHFFLLRFFSFVYSSFLFLIRILLFPLRFF